jgi:hypothetical protein
MPSGAFAGTQLELGAHPLDQEKHESASGAQVLKQVPAQHDHYQRRSAPAKRIA